ncbi:hypothetical protein [Pseudomonas aeruginosa]|uniref:hypothetical protein n=1 Tax=Pseudomonas aeruginosa TaxID=287 RepID=UPI000B5A94D1|nr:hypothetical protein [Pseudomonas aeruginosa]ASJ88843.1 hypothetical protein PSA83_06717 [Pseudomonas aeruginosa]
MEPVDFERLLATGKDLSESLRRYDQEIVQRLTNMVVLVLLAFITMTVTASYVDTLLLQPDSRGPLWLFFAGGMGLSICASFVGIHFNNRRLSAVMRNRKQDQVMLSNVKVVLVEGLANRQDAGVGRDQLEVERLR